MHADTSVEIVGSSSSGKVRPTNEDSWIARVTDRHQLGYLVAVADGMGGHGGGGVASATAIESLKTAVEGSSDLADLRQLLAMAFDEANQKVLAIGEGEAGRHAGTTLTAAVVRKGLYAIGHVGDTRAYLVLPTRVLQITEDDSWVAEQVSMGLLKPDDARHSTHRSQLVRALGTQPVVEPSFYWGNIGPGEALVICSDGFWESVSPLEILEAVHRENSLQRAVDGLLALALDRDGEDNVTVVALRLAGSVAAEERLRVKAIARAPTPVPKSPSPAGS